MSATLAALDRGASGGVYDIVDDQPVSMSEIARAMAVYAGAPAPRTVPAWLPRLLSRYLATMTALRWPLSDTEARAALGWHPAFATIREGLAETVARAP